MSDICDVCGKSLIVNGTKVVGICIILGGTAEYIHPYKTKEYNICFPCWLKSLGVKP